MAALTNPIYDVQRLGIYFTASPKHADVLLVTGVGAAGMLDPLRHTYEVMPQPKVVIAAGTDAISGGLIGRATPRRAGSATHVPVDVFVPGSPPTPFGLLHGILLAVGLLGPSRSNGFLDSRAPGRRRAGLPGGPTGGGRPVSADLWLPRWPASRPGWSSTSLWASEARCGAALPYLLALAGACACSSLGARATTGAPTSDRHHRASSGSVTTRCASTRWPACS